MQKFWTAFGENLERGDGANEPLCAFEEGWVRIGNKVYRFADAKELSRRLDDFLKDPWTIRILKPYEDDPNLVTLHIPGDDG